MDKVKDGTIILFAGVHNNSAYDFRQDNDFYYFTGLEIPNAVLIMNAKYKRTQLFVPRITKAEERMSGPTLLSDPDNLKKTLIDRILPHDYLIRTYAYLATRPAINIYIRLSSHDTDGSSRTEVMMRSNSDARNILNDRQPISKIQVQKLMNRCPQHNFIDVTPKIDEMRYVKDKSEIKILKINGKISAEAHIEAMKITRPGVFEYQIEAAAMSHILKKGAMGPAYPPIVASGPNTCILHYEKNDRKAKSGELILMDFGGQFNYLCMDISRTWPVSGKFTKEQKKIYQTVLEVQKAVIECLKPGVTQKDVRIYVAKRLKEKKIDSMGIIGRYHHTVGLSTHDVGSWGATLKEGTVLAVEPGYYDKKTNIGIRIEDTVLITKNGCIVLTKDVPKEIDEIEKLMRKNR